MSRPGINATLKPPIIAVVGVGLIGGSFAAALKKFGGASHVIGVGRHAYSLNQAKSLGLIDEVATLPEAAKKANVIMISTPVGVIPDVIEQLKPFINTSTIITDAGSTKHEIVNKARKILGSKSGHFVPGHPIAGSENAGPEAASPDLFKDRTVVLTPLEENSSESIDTIVSLWEQCGARMVSMDPDIHDRALASVSHVPHFLASVFMWQVASADDSDLRLTLAGSGFRDFTRISAGSPEVWRDIFLANRDAVLLELTEFKEALEQAKAALINSDAKSLEEFLDKAALARRLWGSRTK